MMEKIYLFKNNSFSRVVDQSRTQSKCSFPTLGLTDGYLETVNTK